MKYKKQAWIFVILCIFMSSYTTAYYCYQESANTTNQTGIDGNCGLKYSGNYLRTGGWYYGGGQLWDGIYSTGDTCSPSGTSYLYINYSAPDRAINATWFTKDLYDGIYNNNSLNGCFFISKVQLRYASVCSPVSSRCECYNGTNWITLSTTSNYNTLADEGIYWGISPVIVKLNKFSLKNYIFKILN